MDVSARTQYVQSSLTFHAIHPGTQISSGMICCLCLNSLASTCATFSAIYMTASITRLCFGVIIMWAVNAQWAILTTAAESFDCSGHWVPTFQLQIMRGVQQRNFRRVRYNKARRKGGGKRGSVPACQIFAGVLPFYPIFLRYTVR